MNAPWLNRLLHAHAMNRHRLVLLVGHFRKNPSNPMACNCPTFLSNPLFLLNQGIPPLGTIDFNDLAIRVQSL